MSPIAASYISASIMHAANMLRMTTGALGITELRKSVHGFDHLIESPALMQVDNEMRDAQLGERGESLGHIRWVGRLSVGRRAPGLRR